MAFPWTSLAMTASQLIQDLTTACNWPCIVSLEPQATRPAVHEWAKWTSDVRSRFIRVRLNAIRAVGVLFALIGFPPSW